jgi:hypothetical protein
MLVFALVAVAFIIVFVIVITWVSCHGAFVFIDNVSRNEARITIPWKKYSAQAWNLFWFYLAAVVLLILGGIICFAVGLALLPVLNGLHESVAVLAGAAAIIGLIILLWMAAFGVKAILIPRMFIKQCKVREAICDGWELFCEAPWHWLLFMLIYLLLWIGITILILISCLFTCCLAILPYVHHVLFLPVYVFMQAYILFFLAQFGPEWNAFPARPDAPPTLPAESDAR